MKIGGKDITLTPAQEQAMTECLSRMPGSMDKEHAIIVCAREVGITPQVLRTYTDQELVAIATFIWNTVQSMSSVQQGMFGIPVYTAFDKLPQMDRQQVLAGLKSRIVTEGLGAYLRTRRGPWGDKVQGVVIKGLKSYL